MALGNLLSDAAVATLRRLIREENAKYRNERPLRARWDNQPRSLLLGKTDEAITGQSGTPGTVSVYQGTPGTNSDTGVNVEAESWVDIDSGIYVNLRRRGGAWECYPLECNA